MTEFIKLNINPDGSKLIIDAKVLDYSYFENVYIKEIRIDTQDTYFSPYEPSSKSFVYEAPANSKRFTLEIGKELNIDFNNNLLYVYIVTEGMPSAYTPCGMDTTIKLGVTYNKSVFYKEIMHTMKGIECECSIPREYINKLLRLKAIELSIETFNFPQANKYWKKFMPIYNNGTVINRCKCNG